MADPSLEAAIDRLYHLPLDEFVGERDKMAREADRQHARVIRQQAKPSVAAWSLNQLYWSARPTFERLVEATARLREAQANALLRREHDYPAADAAHRAALSEAVRETGRILRAAGHPSTPDALRMITGALEALPWAERPGRLARPPSSQGFSVLAGLPAAAPPPPLAEPPSDRKRTPNRPTAAPPAAKAAPPPTAPRKVPGEKGKKEREREREREKRLLRERERERERLVALEALAAARAAASATGARLGESRERLARAEEADRIARERLQEAARELKDARADERAAERADDAARDAIRKADATAARRHRPR